MQLEDNVIVEKMLSTIAGVDEAAKKAAAKEVSQQILQNLGKTLYIYVSQNA